MEIIRYNVWYASERKAKSATKFLAFDDKGTFEITKTFLNFTGRKTSFKIEKESIKNMCLVRQTINWVVYLVFNLFFILTGQIFILLIADVIGLLIALNTKWVCITYLQGTETKNIYIADNSSFGWGGIFGGTRKMFQIVKKWSVSDL